MVRYRHYLKTIVATSVDCSNEKKHHFVLQPVPFPLILETVPPFRTFSLRESIQGDDVFRVDAPSLLRLDAYDLNEDCVGAAK